MNALLWTPSPNDALVLELLAELGPVPLKELTARAGKGYSTVAQTVQRLKSRGYVARRYGSTELLPAAREYLEARQRHQLRASPPVARRPDTATERAPEPPGVGAIALPGAQTSASYAAGAARPKTPSASELPPDLQHASRAAEVAPLSGTARRAEGERAEPRGSALGPPLQSLVLQLQASQDPLLRAANARLQARVSELEAEAAELRRQLRTLRERLAFAASAL